MSKFNSSNKLKMVSIDGEILNVPEQSNLGDIVDADVISVEAVDSQTGKNRHITRDQFDHVKVPEGYSTNLTEIDKG